MASILNNIEESPNTQRGPSYLSGSDVNEVDSRLEPGAFCRSSGLDYLYLS